MHLARSLRVNLFASAVLLFAASASIAQDATEELESVLRDTLVKAVASNTALHGVWADVRRVEGRGKGFEIDAIVDSQPAVEKSQVEELTQVVKSVVKAAPFKIKPVEKLPFRQFVEELKLDIELDAELAGASVDDAYLTTESGDEVLVVLLGRVLNDNQRARMTDMSNQKLEKLFVGSTRKITLTKTKPENGEGVIEFLPSAEVAQFCFGLAIQKFTNRQYGEAYRVFTQAHHDAPTRTDIQYWRAVSLLGAGREPEARRLLQGVIKINRQAGVIPADPAVFRSLEPVQGSLRMRLMALENSLFCKSCE